MFNDTSESFQTREKSCFIQEIKSIHCGSKIIVMSGGLVLTPDAYLDEAHENGADHTLAKPIDRQMLVGTVKACLD